MIGSLWFLAGGILFTVVGFRIQNTFNDLRRCGKKAAAIIVSNNCKNDGDGTMYYAVVRFLTDRNEWITQETGVGSGMPAVDGQKVEVIYDPVNPTIVELNTRFNFIILPKIIIGVGILCLIISALIALGVAD